MRLRNRNGRNKSVKEQERTGKSRIDWMLLFIVAVLIILGLIMQYSASSYDLSLVRKQGLFAVLGFGFLFIIRFIPARFLNRVSVLIYIFATGLTAITYVIGKDVKGAKRWIEFRGFTFQPSELLKAALILAMAAIICRYINEINNQEEIRIIDLIRNRKEIRLGDYLHSIRGYLMMLMCMGVAALVVAVATKDLGTAIIIFAVGFVMMLVVSPRIKYLIAIIGIAVAAAVGLVLAFPYRMGRVTAWLDLDHNTSDLGYQIKQGLYAIGSGGWFGKGLGKSIQKEVIPEPHTDMIFTVVCEEIGIIGGIVIIVLFVLLILRLKTNYDQTRDLFGKMIIVGVASHIAVQTFINIAVMTNLIPNTGVPLPFISYGGTSLICLLGEIGMVQAVRAAGLDTEKNNVYDKS